MRCDAVLCLEAEERQSSCHHPWGYMERVHPPTTPTIPQDTPEKPASL